MPPEDRIGPDDMGHLLKRLLAELFSDVGRRSSLAVGQAQTTLPSRLLSRTGARIRLECQNQPVGGRETKAPNLLGGGGFQYFDQTGDSAMARFLLD